jgi:uncharacterized protein (UPF0332 family)
VTPQAALFLEKARKLLVEADTMLSVNLNEAAGQTAYLAGFHVAEALIFERLGKVLKTHNGAQTEFLRLTRDDPRVNADLRLFLSRTYNLKSIADYETGPGSDVSAARASAALDESKRFVAHFAKLIAL